MKKFAFKKIDAFATETSQGNPAGAVYLEANQDISAQEMQRIARELKGFVSEVGYLRPVGEGTHKEVTFELTYYSAERQVDFCGHATIAILYDLLETNPAYMHETEVTIITQKGKLLVENRIEQEGAVFISAPLPGFSTRTVERGALAAALHISPEAISQTLPVSIVNAGLETLIVPFRSLQAVLALDPPLEELKQYCQETAVDIITIFTGDVADPANRYRSRVFAPTFGYLEDPATGSGNAALGYYLLQQQQWDGSFISLEQNGSRSNPNIVKLSARPRGENTWQVIFGGSAITRISGEYLLT